MERALKNIFLVCFALIPIAIVDGSLKSYLDIKICIMMALTGVLALDLLFKKNEIKSPPFFIVLFIFLLLRLILIGEVINLGLQLQFISLLVASLGIGVWVYNSKLSVNYFFAALLPGIVVSIICSLSMVLYRVYLLSYYSAFGAPIGLKNSLSVFLAQTLPILFLGLLNCEKYKSKLGVSCKSILYLLITLSLWVVFANRTRSAWWMVIIFLFILLWSYKKKLKPALSYSIGLSVCSLIAILLTLYYPNELKWKSSSPYLDSLTTMASLEHSSGRHILWKVALEIVKLNPFFGLGTANYSLLWHDYMPLINLQPRSIRLLRPDLPLYNDYFQVLVENGIFTSLIFAGLFLLYPIYLIFKKQLSFNAILLLSVCLITAFDALVDFPFNRPETILIFAVAMAMALREIDAGIIINKSIARSILGCVLVFSLFMSVTLGGAVYFRRSFIYTKDVGDLKMAWLFWPWDCQWGRGTISDLLKVGDTQFAREIIEKRSIYWPKDYENQVMKEMLDGQK